MLFEKESPELNSPVHLSLSGRPAIAVLALVGITAGVLIGRESLRTVVGCGAPMTASPRGPRRTGKRARTTWW